MASSTAYAGDKIKEVWGAPTNDNALLIVQMPEMAGKALLLQGSHDQLVGNAPWESKLPLVRAFTVPAGKYAAVFQTDYGIFSDAVNLDIKAGQTKVISFEGTDDPSKVLLSFKDPQALEVDEVIGVLLKAGYLKKDSIATHINPSDNVLKFSTNMPWKPPPPPK